MSHRFSNVRRIRDEIASRAWATLPQQIRILILEDASRAVEEVLKERKHAKHT